MPDAYASGGGVPPPGQKRRLRSADEGAFPRPVSRAEISAPMEYCVHFQAEKNFHRVFASKLGYPQNPQSTYPGGVDKKKRAMKGKNGKGEKTYPAVFPSGGRGYPQIGEKDAPRPGRLPRKNRNDIMIKRSARWRSQRCGRRDPHQRGYKANFLCLSTTFCTARLKSRQP